MDVSPIKTTASKRLSLLYLLFLSGLAFISVDLISFPSDEVSRDQNVEMFNLSALCLS